MTGVAANPWRFIAIEGVVGVGKTTLARMLAERLDARLNLEMVEDNPYLERFYQDRRELAFQTQMFFLLSRYRQLLGLGQLDLFSGRTVADYLFAKDRIFANINLDDEDLRLYEHVAEVLEERVPRPDLVVYLQASTEVLMRRIDWRGRSYERDMDPAYIQTLNEAYNYYFFHYDESPLLVVNCNDLDFVRNLSHFEDLLTRIVQPFTGTRYYVPSWSQDP
jgi:deoxyadenosine/deoxycytidine kinase